MACPQLENAGYFSRLILPNRRSRSGNRETIPGQQEAPAKSQPSTNNATPNRLLSYIETPPLSMSLPS
jgi:hypothetical protein